MLQVSNNIVNRVHVSLHFAHNTGHYLEIRASTKSEICQLCTCKIPENCKSQTADFGFEKKISDLPSYLHPSLSMISVASC